MQVFDGPTLEREDTRRDYGERRFAAIGKADGIELTVVYSDRQVGARLIERRLMSARRSNRRERRAYAKVVA